MTTLDFSADLARLGDDLERAAARTLATRRRRPRARAAAVAFVLLTVIATGTAVATRMFSPKQVAAGMPAGALIFGDTHPTCTLASDGTTYRCTLAQAPTKEPYEPGAKELLAIDGRIAGGCIGRDEAGLRWDCYLGTEAVRQGVLTEDLLDQPLQGPTRG